MRPVKLQIVENGSVTRKFMVDTFTREERRTVEDLKRMLPYHPDWGEHVLEALFRLLLPTEDAGPSDALLHHYTEIIHKIVEAIGADEKDKMRRRAQELGIRLVRN